MTWIEQWNPSKFSEQFIDRYLWYMCKLLHGIEKGSQSDGRCLAADKEVVDNAELGEKSG